MNPPRRLPVPMSFAPRSPFPVLAPDAFPITKEAATIPMVPAVAARLIMAPTIAQARAVSDAVGEIMPGWAQRCGKVFPNGEAIILMCRPGGGDEIVSLATIARAIEVTRVGYAEETAPDPLFSPLAERWEFVRCLLEQDGRDNPDLVTGIVSSLSPCAHAGKGMVSQVREAIAAVAER